MDANATTFALYIQRLGGEEGFTAMRSRRRNGGFVTGATTDVVVGRPLYTGSFHSFNRRIRDALVAAWRMPDDQTGRLFDSLAWFRRASTDADNVEPEVDLVLILTAVDHLLAHAGTSRAGLDQERVKELLAPFETVPCFHVFVKNKPVVERSHIEIVLFVLNATRNASLHPRRFDVADQFAFERNAKVTFPWLADRCYMALLAARLVELGTLSADDDTPAFIAGVEDWIQSPVEDVGHMILDAKLRIGLRTWLEDAYEKEIVAVGPDAKPDEARRSWERDFRIALGTVPEPLHVEIQWLADGNGAIILYEGDRLSRESLVEYSQIDIVNDKPVTMAYATQVWFNRDAGRGPEEPKRTGSAARALADPSIWIGGGTIAI